MPGPHALHVSLLILTLFLGILSHPHPCGVAEAERDAQRGEATRSKPCVWRVAELEFGPSAV